MKKYNAFTMIEMIISMCIMAFFIIAIAFSVNKNAQKRLGMTTGGFYACYKDSNNNLRAKTEIRYEDTTYKNDVSVSTCTFDLPEGIVTYNVAIVGAGGGAGGADEPVVTYKDDARGGVYGDIASPFSCFSSFAGNREKCDNNGCVRENGALGSYEYIQNTLNNYMTDGAFEGLFLKDITSVVQGGSDLNGDNGARCGVITSYKIGDRYLCLNGMDETGDALEEGLLNGSWTSSSKGLLNVKGVDLVVAQGKVAYDGYSEGNTSFAQSPICLKGMATNDDLGMNFSGGSYNAEVIESIRLTMGLAGEAGNYQVYPSQNVSNIANNRKVVIRAENIGNAGQAGVAGASGTDGSSTVFEFVSGDASVEGGRGGAVKQVDCVIEPSKVNTANLASYENYKECYFEGEKALVSSYVRDEIFPQTSVAGQQKLMSNSGYCDENQCVDAKAAESISYGNGGSSGAVRVFYDYIKRFKLINGAGAVVKSTPENGLEFEYSAGANGSGGAIIISW